MTAPFAVIVETQRNAEKNGCRRAYLARLRAGPRGAIEREFAPKVTGLKGNRRAFSTPAHPGEVFEARRWRWNGERYAGGECWFGVMADGSLFTLSRDEAFASVHATKISSDAAPVEPPMVERPNRMQPEDVFIRAMPS